MDEIDKPAETDVVTESVDESIENIFEETGETDVEGKGEAVNSLSLDEINSTLKREFKTKEEALKSLDGLKRLVGDQELAKERKEKKSGDDVDARIAQLEKSIATKDFLLEVPTAKEHLDLVEAYAEKHGLSLSEAWTAKFTKFSESSQQVAQKAVINKNRITPVQSQQIASLAEQARRGDPDATAKLINETVWKK